MVVMLEDLGLATQDKHERPSCRTDVKRLEIVVQDKDR
jgi:hypothetical protein